METNMRIELPLSTGKPVVDEGFLGVSLKIQVSAHAGHGML
jgi:hypothetical protein